MSKEVLQFAVIFILTITVQVLICNHIALFNVAVPIVFIYFVIRLPMDIGKGLLYTLAFLSGLLVDIFSDTPGVNALACILLAAVKRPVYYAYVPRDDKTRSLVPSVSTLGLSTYCKVLVTMVGIYCLLAFTIEYFNFADVKEIAVLASSSCLLTFILLLATDCLIVTKP